MVSIIESKMGIKEAIKLPEVESNHKMRRSAFVAEKLQQMIYDGTLKPGDRLPTEENLCNHFSVSRTTLRESIQMLRVSGLLDVSPGRGSFITLPKMEDLMKNLMVVGRYNVVDKSEVSQSQIAIMQDVIQTLCRRKINPSRQLKVASLSREASPYDNAMREQTWMLKIIDLTGNKMEHMLMSLLLNIALPWRAEALKSEEELIRATAIQIKINTLIEEGDEETACRLMRNYLQS